MGCGTSRPAADQFHHASQPTAYDYYGHSQAQGHINYAGPSAAQYSKPSGYTQPAGYPTTTQAAYSNSPYDTIPKPQYGSKPQGYPQPPSGYPGAQPHTQYGVAPGYPAAGQPYGYPQAPPPGYPGAPVAPGAYQQHLGAYQQYAGQGPYGTAQQYQGNSKPPKRPGLGAGSGLAVGLLGGLAAAALVDAAF